MNSKDNNHKDKTSKYYSNVSERGIGKYEDYEDYEEYNEYLEYHQEYDLEQFPEHNFAHQRPYRSRASKIADRGVSLLPNLFTIGALFAGFYGIVAATKGLFEIAAIALFIAMLLDNLDGRVARMTNTQSKLGAELDSLSDMVAFGVAPALIVYHWSLIGLGKIGWLLSFLFTANAAIRLARFNSQIDIADKRYFNGLPAPVAAAVIVGFVWNCVDLDYSGSIKFIRIITGVLTALAAGLMVSNLKYYSFKTLQFGGRTHYLWIFAIVVLLIIIVLEPAKVLFLGCLIYACSGFVTTYLERRKQKSEESIEQESK